MEAQSSPASPNASDWTERDSSVTTRLDVVISNGTQFVAAGPIVVKSPDGIQWTPTTPNGLEVFDIVWNGDFFLACGQNGGVWTSSDGTDWAPRQWYIDGAGRVFHGAVWDGTRFLVVGSDRSIIQSEAIVSPVAPKLALRLNSDRTRVLEISYTPNRKVIVESSRDLKQWTSEPATVIPAGGILQVNAPNLFQTPHRFFRARTLD